MKIKAELLRFYVSNLLCGVKVIRKRIRLAGLSRDTCS